jgi:hypothetical protein
MQDQQHVIMKNHAFKIGIDVIAMGIDGTVRIREESHRRSGNQIKA